MILGLETPAPATFVDPADVKPETVLHVERLNCARCDLDTQGRVLLCTFHDGFNQGVAAGQFVCSCKRLDCKALRHEGRA